MNLETRIKDFDDVWVKLKDLSLIVAFLCWLNFIGEFTLMVSLIYSLYK